MGRLDYKKVKSVLKSLKGLKIDFTVVGGAAVSLHTGKSAKDIDILVTHEDQLLSRENVLLKKGYSLVNYDSKGRPGTIIDLSGKVKIDLLYPDTQFGSYSDSKGFGTYSTERIDGIKVLDATSLIKTSKPSVFRVRESELLKSKDLPYNNKGLSGRDRDTYNLSWLETNGLGTRLDRLIKSNPEGARKLVKGLDTKELSKSVVLQEFKLLESTKE